MTSSKKKNTYLLIVESPSKCAKIEEYLGPNYQCISSKGHFREIDGLGAIDLKNQFKPTYTLIPEKADHVAQMRKTIKTYPKHHILIATDDDREGEAIAWHICDEFGLPIDSTPRIVFHEITKPAILKAVENPTTLNLSLVSAAKARQVLDMMVGFKLSPLLWRNVSKTKSKSGALSAGRCQTPALRLVHDNDLLCKSATQNTVSKVYGTFFSRNIRFRLSRDFDNQDSLLSFLEKSKTFTHTLSIDKTKPSSQSPPKPFTTSRLLQQASSQLHLSPKTTMELCQTLYQSGLITYMRTDSAKFSPVFLEKAREYIVAQFGDTYIGDLASLEQKDATNPHEAIRPTNLSLKHYQTDNASLSRLYTFIWKTSIQACMSAARSNKTCVRVSCPLVDTFYEYVVETPLHLGWQKLAENAEKMPGIGSEGLLFYFQSQNLVSWSKIETETAQETRVSHYTEASLIQRLEELGIGRPSTFASLVATIEDRGYVKKMDVKGRVIECTNYELAPDGTMNTRIFEKVFGEEKSKLVLQPIGSLVLAFLLNHFDTFFSYGYTESMEKALDQIAAMPAEEAIDSWSNICQQCLDELEERMEPLKRAKKHAFFLQDANYELVFSSYGASVKHVLEDGTTEYIPVSPERTNSLDLEKAKRGEYSVEDLIDTHTNHLGVYEDQNVVVKTGKYGAYAQWGTKTQSLKSLVAEKPVSEITMADFLALMEEKSERDTPKDRSTLRTLTPNLSIRKGKYGAYIYHKTDAMEKPAFYPLKEMRAKWQTCDTPALIQWIQNTYNI